MQVLVTRAREDAVRTAEKLAALGHEAIISPVLNMVATEAPWPAGVVDAVIATSAQAFDLLNMAPEWPQPEARRLLPLFVVGERTEAAARQRGFYGPAVLAADAKELAELFLARPEPAARALYLAGRDRKSDFERRLAEAEISVEPLEVYEARAAARLDQAAVAFIDAGTAGVVLHYSRRSAEIFLHLVEISGMDPQALLHAAISDDAATPLRDAGLPHIAIAAEPNEAALLAQIAHRP